MFFHIKSCIILTSAAFKHQTDFSAISASYIQHGYNIIPIKCQGKNNLQDNLTV